MNKFTAEQHTFTTLTSYHWISQVIPRNRVLLDKLSVTQLFKKCSTFYGIQIFITMLTKPVCTLNMINPVHTLPPNFLNIKFNIILPSMPRSSLQSYQTTCCSHFSAPTYVLLPLPITSSLI